jgi:hypothetical protein
MTVRRNTELAMAVYSWATGDIKDKQVNGED